MHFQALRQGSEEYVSQNWISSRDYNLYACVLKQEMCPIRVGKVFLKMQKSHGRSEFL